MANLFISELFKVYTSFIDLVYPPLCLHCEELLLREERLFCRGCSQLFALIDHLERCPYCFSPDFCPQKHVCYDCKNKYPVLHRTGAAFEYLGPPATLVKKMKYGDQPYLAKGAAAYLLLQLDAMGWPLPDVVIPVPISFTHKLERGYNQSLLLAQALGILINRPVADILKRSSNDFSQAALPRNLRMNLSERSFSLSKKIRIEDQIVLVIDDVATTGSTLRCCAEALQACYPAKIYGLTLCHTS